MLPETKTHDEVLRELTPTVIGGGAVRMGETRERANEIAAAAAEEE